MATGVSVWSKTAATNNTADSAVNWQEGQSPSSVNDSARGMMAATAKWRDDLNGTIATTGTSTAYVATSNQTFASLTAGIEITCQFDEDCGATVTLNVDGLGAKPLRPAAGVELIAGAIKAGSIHRATYATSNSGEWLLHDVSPMAITGNTAITTPALDDELPIYDLSGTANAKITPGNLFKVIGLLSSDTTPDVASDFFLSYDASASAPKKVPLANVPSIYPPGFIYGLTLANGTDATNDINISAGNCRDELNTQNITLSAITKQLDSSWAAGTNAGGRSSASLADGTWHVFVIAKSDGTSDVLYHTAVDPTSVLPSGYTVYRRIGSIIRASGTILAFTQFGDDFELTTPIQDVAVNSPSSSAATRTLSVPIGIIVHAKLRAMMINTDTNTATAYGVIISPLTSADEAPTLDFASPANFDIPPTLNGRAGSLGVRLEIRTNTSGQIRTRNGATTGGNVNLYIRTVGWIDRRGK